jgi:hypothetical protein
VPESVDQGMSGAHGYGRVHIPSSDVPGLQFLAPEAQLCLMGKGSLLNPCFFPTGHPVGVRGH